MKKKLILFAAFALYSASTLNAQKKKYTPEKKNKDIASYYADRFQGKKMANGDLYHRDSFTCAHLRYAFGTLLKVRNPMNQKECLVKVTDRGPYSRKFTIDLSHAAADYLGLIGRGYIQVELTPYYSGQVPYRLGPIEYPEMPELAIDFQPAATYPYPIWHNDSVVHPPATAPKLRLPLKKRHR